MKKKKTSLHSKLLQPSKQNKPALTLIFQYIRKHPNVAVEKTDSYYLSALTRGERDTPPRVDAGAFCVVSQSQDEEVWWCPTLFVFQGQMTVCAKFDRNVYLPKDAEFYFIYNGSQQRHVVIAERTEDNVLQSSIPGEVSSLPSSREICLWASSHQGQRLGRKPGRESQRCFPGMSGWEGVCLCVLGRFSSRPRFFQRCLQLSEQPSLPSTLKAGCALDAVQWRWHCISGSPLVVLGPIARDGSGRRMLNLNVSSFSLPHSLWPVRRPRVCLPLLAPFGGWGSLPGTLSIQTLPCWISGSRTFSSHHPTGHVLKPVILPDGFFNHHGDRWQITVSC